jgi:hypothetical protein
MTRQTLFRILVVSAVAAIVALTLHILIQQWSQPIISANMVGVEVARPPYGLLITGVAYVTAMVPAIVAAILFYYAGRLLPARTRFGKGLWLGVLILLLKGDLVRQPMMNFLIGNPPTVVVLNDLHVIGANLALGLAIGLLCPMKGVA